MMRRVNILCSFALLFASHTSLAVTYHYLQRVAVWWGSRLL